MIPRSVIDNLKCTFCKNGLSVFPIHTYGDKDTVTCGRCPVKQEFLPQRELLYEELAQYIEFPCQYQSSGCIEKLTPTELGNHEDRCPHKPCLCPALPLGECRWRGAYDELYEHYRLTHPALALQDFNVEIDIVNSYEENYVFHQEEETFIAQLKCDVAKSQFYCNITGCGKASATKKFSYRLCFTNNKSNYSCAVRDVNFGTLEAIRNSNATVVNINDIIINLNNPVCIICKVQLFSKTVTVEKKKSNFVEDENEILKTIECPVCFDYMVPPIMQCNRGHSFCESHRTEFSVCPQCQGAVGETRNYLLEEITNIIAYPCKYSKFDCDFSANAMDIRAHEATCIHGPYKCILDSCSWQNKFSDLKPHLGQMHKEAIIEISSLTYILDNDSPAETNAYIAFSHDAIFRVYFRRDNDMFYWSLQIVGSNNDSVCDNYMLELDFESQAKEKIYIRKKSGPFVDYSSINQDLIVELSMKHLESFIVDDMLNYKFRVVETK